MMLKRNRHILLLVVAAITCITYGCTKKWDEHFGITDSNLKEKLAETISKTANLGKFNELLVKSGYDKLLSSSQTYTVWAPTDAALQSLDPSIINDSAKLRQFVANHISYEGYLSNNQTAEKRIKMLNGKYIAVTGGTFDSAAVITPNVYANNGVVHVVNKFIPRTDNIWEFVNNAAVAPAMKSFLLSLNRYDFDPSKAKQLSVDPVTGLPVYDTATGLVQRNGFLDTVMNVSDENAQYTMFMLADNAYNIEFNKLTPWLRTSSTDSTNRIAGFWLVKDLVVKGLYTMANLPDTLMSQDSVKIPVNKSAIVGTYKTSNGIVYLMNEMNFALKHKFPPIYVQGENPTQFVAARNSNVVYRTRYNPVTGRNFNDIFMTNYNYANYWIRYLVRNIPNMRYNVYWVAVNDVQTSPLWSQRLGIDTTTNNLPAQTIQYRNYQEVYLGQFTVQRYRNVNLYLIGPNAASSQGGSGSIVLDYVKLDPLF